MRRKKPARGRNLTDPLKARQPLGKGRLSAGPQARLTRRETGRDRTGQPPRALTRLPLRGRLTREEGRTRLPVRVGPGDLR